MTGYFNAGQDCTAATRVIAGPKVYGDFVEALAEAAKGTKTGAPNDDVLYGALNNSNQLARVNGFIEKAPKHARVVAGGNKIGNDGYFFEPTVVADLKQSDDMIQQEIFGPVITVQKFSDEAECAWRRHSISAACGSTRISPWWPRCRTAVTKSLATAKIFRPMRSTTTPASST
jgi:betaine-aldehyde dehydrogenase